LLNEIAFVIEKAANFEKLSFFANEFLEVLVKLDTSTLLAKNLRTYLLSFRINR
jgi:hypothetical protein